MTLHLYKGTVYKEIFDLQFFFIIRTLTNGLKQFRFWLKLSQVTVVRGRGGFYCIYKKKSGRQNLVGLYCTRFT